MKLSSIRHKYLKDPWQYFVIFVIVIGIGFGGYGLLRHPQKQPTLAATNVLKTVSTKALKTAPASPTTTPPLAIAEPQRLIIPTIGVNANIQYVGLTPGGDLGTPSNSTDVAWYKDGPLPGNPGNAVIDGHLDWLADPAVFWNLNKLQIGDLVEVVDINSHVSQFKVTNIQSYGLNSAPLQEIFGPTNQVHLNLITCSGSWDQNSRLYSQRLVVSTVLE